MEIYYEGKDITDLVQVRKCIVKDTSGERCDSLEIEFENAEGWYRWGPQEGDEIFAAHNRYDTGIMYVNAVLPENGKFRILATSLPYRARTKAYRSFCGKTIESIMRTCAMASGMGFQLYGIDKDAMIPYIQQENEECAAFLHRILQREGAILKCVNGKYTAIDIQWAQEQATFQTIELTAKQNGVVHWRNGRKYKALTVQSPYAKATAEDLAADKDSSIQSAICLPVMSDVQAGRWARGLLLAHNRQCETLELQSEFNPGFTAMARVNIISSTDTSGEWMVEEAQHDLKNSISTAKMRRCIQTIR